MHRTLDLISQALSQPVADWVVAVEPREVPREPAGQPTAWDVGIYPANTLVEAKLRPKRADVVEYLRRSAMAAPTAQTRTFSFVYSSSPPPLLVSVERLILLAKEAGGNEEQLQHLIDLERIEQADEILSVLGSQRAILLQRLIVENRPEGLLRELVEFYARCLAGPMGTRLIEMVFYRLQKAIAGRERIRITDVIEIVREAGIELQAPPVVTVAGLAVAVLDALIISQACPFPVPLVVGARSGASTIEDFHQALTPLTAQGAVTVDGAGYCFRHRAVNRLAVPNRDHVLSEGLRQILAFISSQVSGPQRLLQVSNAVALMKECSLSRPEVVATSFAVLDKPVKRFGDKHLVLEVARLAIGAARRASRTDEIIDAEARALICGEAWVYQRIDRLEEAASAATKAKDLANAVGSEVTLAFCLKCLGRLRRLEAERLTMPVRKTKLAESARLLEDAIARFSRLGGYGPHHQEVGDCYSLLGRTHLVDGRLADASAAIQQALPRITDETSKDFVDLQILIGDFYLAQGSLEEATAFYDRALAVRCAGDPDRSEMHARALRQKAVILERRGNVTVAASLYRNAAEIWSSLAEYKAAARAKWDEYRITEDLSDDAIRILSEEPATVAVAALEEHKRRLAAVAGRGLSRRMKPGASYWVQLLDHARRRVAAEDIEW